MTARFVKAQQCLSADRELAVLLPEARRLLKLEARLAGVLGRLARQTQIAGVRGETLWLQCANGSVATRLRTLERSILTAMTAAGVTVTAMKLRVRADVAWQRPRVKAVVSAKGLDALRAFQAELPKGDALSEAVQRLLAHQAGRLE